jgi:two-component system, OmpR family, response regulator VicR
VSGRGREGCFRPEQVFLSGGRVPGWHGEVAVTGKRVLCIEDHPEMIELIRLILGRQGFEVEGAIGGREGLRIMRDNPPDLVLLDLMMPDMDGWEVYRQIKADETLKEIPVIAVTAKAQNTDRVLGLHIAGMDDFVTKPFKQKELISSVERVLTASRRAERI